MRLKIIQLYIFMLSQQVLSGRSGLACRHNDTGERMMTYEGNDYPATAILTWL